MDLGSKKVEGCYVKLWRALQVLIGIPSPQIGMRQAGKSFKFSLWQESPLSSLLIRTSAKRTKRIAIYTGFAECLHDRFLQLQTSSEILPLKMGDVWQILFVNKLLTVKGGKRLQATCHLWWTEAPQKGQRLSRCLIKIQNDLVKGIGETPITWMEGAKKNSMASSYRRRSQMVTTASEAGRIYHPNQANPMSPAIRWANQSRASTFYRVLSRKLHSTIQKWECAQCALTTLQTWPQAFLEWKHDLESRPAWFRI